MFWRVFVGQVVVVASVLAVFAVFQAQATRSDAMSRITERLETEAELLEPLIAEYLKRESEGDVQELVRKVGAATGLRITVVAEDGRVMADSHKDARTMENHLNRPEIADARRVGSGKDVRHSIELGQEMLYVARRLDLESGGKVIIRTAISVRQVRTQTARIYRFTALAFAAFAVLGAGATALLTRRVTKPLRELTSNADAIASGASSAKPSHLYRGELGTLADAMTRMGDQIQAQIEALRQRSFQLEAILATMREGVLALDTEGRVLFCNAAARDLLALRSDAEGRYFWESIRDNEIIRAIKQLLATRQPLSLQADTAGRVLGLWGLAREGGAVVLFRDLTESTRYETLRREFVANASHELRTPLTIIRNSIETIEQGAISDPAKRAEFFAIVHKHLDQLTNLVNDLLELSRLESQPSLPQVRPSALGELLRRVAASFAPAIEAKSQRLVVELPDDLPTLELDPELLERAVGNLLDNANKYTPAGGEIRLSASVARGAVKIIVADNGIGIPAADMPRIFERFYRVDKSRSREMGGTGLGLSIVKHIVQLHRGEVSVTSTPGQRSVFTISLPIRSEGSTQ